MKRIKRFCGYGEMMKYGHVFSPPVPQGHFLGDRG